MADYRADPSALRFLIGHDLKITRERAGLKQVDASKVLNCSQARINYLESGKTQQQPEDVEELLRAYGAGSEHIDRMTSLASSVADETWWAPFSGALPHWFKTFVGLEGLATAEFTYQPLLLPGQLQTPEYAAALLVGNLRVAPMDAPQVVQARMARQRLADDSHPLRFRAVIEESVLERTVGGPAVMTAQLEHLWAVMELDNVEVRVMPLDVVVHDGLDGEFMLLDFEAAQSIGYIGYPAGALYIQDQTQVGAYKMAADRLWAAALPHAGSVKAIAARIETLKRSPED
jgi:transcriptional regulator with XRE-family HTH domain